MTPKQRQRATYLGAGAAAAGIAIALFYLLRLLTSGGDPITPPPSQVVLSPSPSAPAAVVPKTMLRLEVAGMMLTTDPLSVPPVFELVDDRVVVLNFPTSEESNRPLTMTSYEVGTDFASGLLAEAEAAGVTGNQWLADPNDLLPVTYTFVLVRDSKEVARVTLNGIVDSSESGPDTAVRKRLWDLAQRMMTPISSFSLRDGEPYLPERYVVFASPLPAELIDQEGIVVHEWSLDLPSRWAGSCHVFFGEELKTVTELLAPVAFGGLWLDPSDAPWSLTGRPMTPSEISVCD